MLFCMPKKILSPRYIAIFLVAVIILLFGQNVSCNDKYGGRIVLATSSDPKSFNSIIAKESSTSAVTNYIFEGLTTVNAHSQKVEPHLARAWSVSEDGLIWVFHLRDDIFWSDGEKFTADDVVFTFNDLIYNEDIPSSARDIFTIEGKVFKVKKINDHTVSFTLPVKFAPFLRSMSQEILPKHKLKNVVENKRFNFTWGIDTPVEEIVGTGPFKLAEYKPGRRIVFDRNPNYWKKSDDGDTLPYLDGIIHMIVQSEDTAFLKFLEGEVDAYSMRGSDFPILKPEEKRLDFTVYELGPGFGTNFLVFNQNKGKNPETGQPFVAPDKLAWFTDVSFRRAMAHVIDKKKIIEILKNGLGYEQNSAVSPASGFFHNPDVKKYKYSIDIAKKILFEASYFDRDGDGFIEDRNGNPMQFNLYTNAGNEERIQIAGIIRHDIEQLGIKVNLQVLEFNTLVSKLNGSFEWEAIILGLTGGGDPHFGKNVWMSSGQLHMWYPTQNSPATEWEKRIDEIFIAGVQELDEDKRKRLYDEFQVIVSEQLPFVYTVLSSNITAVRNKFGNLDPTNYGGVFHNLEEIYIKK